MFKKEGRLIIKNVTTRIYINDIVKIHSLRNTAENTVQQFKHMKLDYSSI